jgi:hypothetical protein
VLQYVARMDIGYQTYFAQTVTNLHGTMPDHAIARILSSPHSHALHGGLRELHEVQLERAA